MAAALSAFQLSDGAGRSVTTEMMDAIYSHVSADELARDVVVVEHVGDGVVGYGRTGSEDTPEGRAQFFVAPIVPAHLHRPLFMALVAGLEQRARQRAAVDPGFAHFIRTWTTHPGPGGPVDDSVARWLEDAGYHPARFGATMLRQHLEAVPERRLPPGVELRAVRVEDLRAIWEADAEACAGSYGVREPTETEWLDFRDNPLNDTSMWKVAWSGDVIVGQVRAFVNHQENEEMNRRRGYTEFISTHVDWRGRGIASALLAASVREVRDRGMHEAALRVDTENPADAFAIYERLGFRLTGYEAIMEKPILSATAL